MQTIQTVVKAHIYLRIAVYNISDQQDDWKYSSIGNNFPFKEKEREREINSSETLLFPLGVSRERFYRITNVPTSWIKSPSRVSLSSQVSTIQPQKSENSWQVSRVYKRILHTFSFWKNNQNDWERPSYCSFTSK